MAQIQFPDGKQVSEWVRYDKDSGLWIPYRKMNYLYWFRFLQIAEREEEYKVDWRKYKLWGGQNAVMGMGFDRWWENYWKECFGIPDRKDKQKFPFTTTRPRTESIRLSWLCYRFKDTPPSGKFTITQAHKTRKASNQSNTIDIANAVYRFETGLDGKKPARDSVGEAFTYSQLNPLGRKLNERSGEFRDNNTADGHKEIRDTVTRALKRARKTLSNVCEGKYP